MQKIVTNLWFDKEAKEAAEFYTTLLPNSQVTNITTLHDTPGGDSDIVTFTLNGYTFTALSAGPEFKINQSISFMINFDPSQDPEAQTRLNNVWNKLVDGGKVLMPIDKYPFSDRYGWVEDKYGVSWQLILTNPQGDKRPLIMPSLLFVNEAYGKALEATDFYLSVFNNTKRGSIAYYPAGMEPDNEGTVMFTDFMLENQWFAAMDSAQDHKFSFNEAVSFIINCDSQEEIDYYWDKLSAVPESEICGWIKDKYGVSWQITPSELNVMLHNGTREKIDRVTQSLLQMKKLNLAVLKEAYNQ